MCTRLTQEEFLTRSIAKHGLKYDYSKAVYTHSHDKVIIGCTIHGDFSIAAHHHLEGVGCKQCNHDSYRMSLEKFKEKAYLIHSGAYSYNNTSDFKNNKCKIIITCPIHGDFEQTVSDHLTGCGCSRCSETIQHTNESFVKKAQEIHSSYYSYSNVDYIDSHKDVIITCHIHGDFKQSPTSHFHGSGCSSCNKGGFKQSKDSVLYLIETDKFLLGISNNFEKRLAQHKRNLDEASISIQTIYTFGLHGMIALSVEGEIKRRFKDYAYTTNIRGFVKESLLLNKTQELIKFCENYAKLHITRTAVTSYRLGKECLEA